MRSCPVLTVLSAVLSCLLLLSACTPAQRDPFAYAAAPFSVTAEGTYLPANDPDGTPRPIAVRITAGEPVNGDPTLRSLTVTFTAPASLGGAAVTAALSPAADGTAGRSVVFTYPSDYGEITVTAKGNEFDGLLRFAEALLPVGDVTAISPAAEDESFTVTRKTADGTREAVFTFAEGKTFPTRVILTDERGRVDVGIVG